MANGPHSHPAFRIPKEEELPSPQFGDDFEAAVRTIAKTRMARERVGVRPDDFTDSIIFVARQWIEREQRSQAFIEELSK